MPRLQVDTTLGDPGYGHRSVIRQMATRRRKLGCLLVALAVLFPSGVWLVRAVNEARIAARRSADL
jgi:hypothetical protein